MGPFWAVIWYFCLEIGTVLGKSALFSFENGTVFGKSYKKHREIGTVFVKFVLFRTKMGPFF